MERGSDCFFPLNTTKARSLAALGRSAGRIALSSRSGWAVSPRFLNRRSGGTRPSALRSKAQALGLRGRITGSSSRPVAIPLRNSRRFETRRETPRYCARGRITWSRPWLTSTTFSAPFSATQARRRGTPSAFSCFFKMYSKYSSPSESRRSRVTPDKRVCSTRVANTRLLAYRKGRTSASARAPPRRAQRPANVWEFQVK